MLGGVKHIRSQTVGMLTNIVHMCLGRGESRDDLSAALWERNESGAVETLGLKTNMATARKSDVVAQFQKIIVFYIYIYGPLTALHAPTYLFS